MSNHNLSEEKPKLRLISSQDILLLLYPVINICRDIVSPLFIRVYNLLNKR